MPPEDCLEAMGSRALSGRFVEERLWMNFCFSEMPGAGGSTLPLPEVCSRVPSTSGSYCSCAVTWLTPPATFVPRISG